MVTSLVLVSAAELYESLSAAVPPVVLDARWRLGGPPGIDSYRAGHIPGAVFVDMDRDLSGPPGAGGRHPLPSAAAFQAAMHAAGVRDRWPVVVYDDGDGLPAARAWWDLRYFGHTQVRVLDGGFRAWTAAALPVSAALPVPAALGDAQGGDFTAHPGGMPVVDASGAAALARDGLLLDVRTPERYRGETEPVDPVAGHIPGAVNFPISGTANPDGTYAPPETITAALAASAPQSRSATGPQSRSATTPQLAPEPMSASASEPALASEPAPASVATGVYCGSGVTAARGVLALELAGVPAALYVGSWSNWIADPSRPIATSP